MNLIVTDFKKTFATIVNSKNETKHISSLINLVNNFEKKHSFKYEVCTFYMCIFLRNEIDILTKKIYGCTQN